MGLGNNQYGVLLNGTTEGHSCEPVKIMNDIVMVSAGARHGMALLKTGGVVLWGDNEEKQISPDKKEGTAFRPALVMEDCVKVFAGLKLSSTVDYEGGVWIWGDMAEMRGGDFAQESGEPIEIVNIGGDSNQPLLLASDGTLYAWDLKKGNINVLAESVRQMSFKSMHVLLLKEDGSVWASGKNEYSQLGDGTTEETSKLILVYPGS